jgi:NitT/TauT family transport system permease protein
MSNADAAVRWTRARGESPVLWYCIAVGLVFVTWQAFVSFSDTPEYLVPPPADVFAALSEFRTILLEEAWVTTRTILIAFVASVALGVAVAIPIAFIRSVRLISSPLLAMSQAVPRIALAPLFIVWFGFGMRTNVIIATSVAVFPVIVNTTLGLMSITTDVVRLGRSMGGTRLRVFRFLRWPLALPSIFAGLKVAVTLAVIGAVVGEFIVGGDGLGYLTISASANQNTPLLFACVISLALIGIAFFGLIEGLERVALRHHAGTWR